MIIISDFLLNSINVCVIASFLTQLLTLGNLFPTAVRLVLVAKLAILGILFLTSFILVLRTVVEAKLVVLDISPLTSFILGSKVVLVAQLVI